MAPLATQFGFLIPQGAAPWPNGSDGPLFVGPGDTYVIPNGSTHDWSSIYLSAGSNLEVSAGNEWTIVGCSGSITFEDLGDGNQPNFQSSGNATSVTMRTVSAVAPDGTVLSCTTPDHADGGAGGSAFAENGVQFAGNGGGGAGFDNASDADFTFGGAGGPSPSPGSDAGVGGNSADQNANSGGAAGDVFADASDPVLYGAGGGGGARGNDGAPLYIRVRGSILGSGLISTNGNQGGNGGNGGSVVVDNPAAICYGGGGGGGGGGGSAADLVIYYGGTIDVTVSTNAYLGDAGGPGSGGIVPEGQFPGGDGDGGSFGIQDGTVTLVMVA